MELLGNTRKLDIRTENCHDAETRYPECSGIKYPLYEANYISGIRTIFQQAIDLSDWKKRNEGRYILDEKRNIFSFIGKRGSGKTTAMDEFCRILSGMNETERKEWWLKNTLNEEEQKELRNKEFYFHILNPIDASLLTDEEDFFELILSNLYHKFEGKMRKDIYYGFKDTPEIRKIMNDFSEVSVLYKNMMSNKMDVAGLNFLSQLQAAGGSQEIQKKITELIEGLMSLDRKGCNYEYIVIPIDDLDLNLNHGYEILEQLQKYFSDYRIIVLAAIDYEQMQLVCEEHFCKQMAVTSKIYDVDHNRKLAYDYMMKIFHLSQRMYMPDIYRFSHKSRICLPEECSAKEKNLSVKNFLLSKVGEAMGIYYDACGTNEHFIEPQTVRSLVSYNEFLESLNLIEYDKLISWRKLNGKAQAETNTEILKKYDQNHEKFNEDILIRAGNRLTTHEYKNIIEELKCQELKNRAECFVYGEPKLGMSKEQFQEEYSYGKLCEKLYSLESDVGDKNYFENQRFAYYNLESFTSEMVCEYIKYRYNPDLKNRMKYKARLMGFMGKTFGGIWIAKGFSGILKKEDIPLRKIESYQEDIAQSTFSVKIDISLLNNTGNIDDNILKENIEKWIEDQQIIETLECVDMFCIRKEENSYRGIDFDFLLKNISSEKVDEDLERKVNEQQNELLVTGRGEPITFDIMAFVAKSLDYEDVQTNLHKNITQGLTKFLSEYLKISENEKKINVVKKVIQESLNQYSMFEECKKNEYDYDVAFPFYNLDLSYNILKRVREQCGGKVNDMNQVLKELNVFYNRIYKGLQEEEKMYQSDHLNYAAIFQESPYMKAMEKWGKKDKVSERLPEVFYHMNIREFIHIAD